MADMELFGGEFSGHGHKALAPKAQQMTSSHHVANLKRMPVVEFICA